jgi:hypothetical protein
MYNKVLEEDDKDKLWLFFIEFQANWIANVQKSRHSCNQMSALFAFV